MKFSAIITFALISLTAAQSFQEQNANDAEKLQEDFKNLTPDSPCKDGDQACVQDQFAQCVGGKFALNSCGGGELKCVVLPLVNKPGTSITCSTEQDRLNRLEAARGGKSPKGNDKGNNIETPESGPEPKNGKNKEKDQPPESDDEQPKQPQQPSKSPESGKDNENDPKIFRPKNADDAEKLQEDFKTLTPDSPCKDGDQACVQDQFAQCVGGKFALNSCGGGELKCVVLPLVNKPGTSITCSTEQDRLNRLAEARGETGKGKDNNEQPPLDNGKGKDNNVNQPDPESPENENDDEQPSDDNKDNEQPEDGEENNENPKQPQSPNPPENGKGKDSTAEIRKKNAEEAEKLQEDFKSFTPDQPCKNNEVACIDDKLAQCANGKFALTECAPGLQCSVLPLVLKEGTTITCTTEADRIARIKEAKNNLK